MSSSTLVACNFKSSGATVMFVVHCLRWKCKKWVARNCETRQQLDFRRIKSVISGNASASAAAESASQSREGWCDVDWSNWIHPVPRVEEWGRAESIRGRFLFLSLESSSFKLRPLTCEVLSFVQFPVCLFYYLFVFYARRFQSTSLHSQKQKCCNHLT